MKINTHKLKVKVTDEHIKKGMPDSCDKCAIALAVQSAIDNTGAPWQCNVELTHRTTTFTKSPKARINIAAWSGKIWEDEVAKSCFVVDDEKGNKEKINQFVSEFDSIFYWDSNTEESTPNKPVVHCKPFDFELEVIT